MKNTLFIILAALLFFSCSPPESECEADGVFFLEWNIQCTSCTEEDERLVNLIINGDQLEVLSFTPTNSSARFNQSVELGFSNTVEYQLVDGTSAEVLVEGELETYYCQNVTLDSSF